MKCLLEWAMMIDLHTPIRSLLFHGMKIDMKRHASLKNLTRMQACPRRSSTSAKIVVVFVCANLIANESGCDNSMLQDDGICRIFCIMTSSCSDGLARHDGNSLSLERQVAYERASDQWIRRSIGKVVLMNRVYQHLPAWIHRPARVSSIRAFPR